MVIRKTYPDMILAVRSPSELLLNIRPTEENISLLRKRKKLLISRFKIFSLQYTNLKSNK